MNSYFLQFSQLLHLQTYCFFLNVWKSWKIHLLCKHQNCQAERTKTTHSATLSSWGEFIFQRGFHIVFWEYSSSICKCSNKWELPKETSLRFVGMPFLKPSIISKHKYLSYCHIQAVHPVSQNLTLSAPGNCNVLTMQK